MNNAKELKQSAEEIFQKFKSRGLLEEMLGPDQPVRRIAPAEKCGPGDLVYIESAEYIKYLDEGNPSVVVVSPELKDEISEGRTLLVSRNPSLAVALMRQAYADRDVRDSGWGRVHASAIVHESVLVPESVVIGPRAVVGRDVKLGEEVVVMAGVIVEHGVVIGARTVVHPGVVIGYNCEIGEDVIIKSGCVIGSEGYGFAQDDERKSHRIPQTGRVVIENDVVLGANNCVDRAAYDETRIGRGTKTDNFCHFAHNVTIGEDCLITANFTVAGSTKIGNRFIASGQCGVLDHLTIADDVLLVHRAGVTDDIHEAGAYAAMPHEPLSQYMKNRAVAKNLVEMRKKIRELEKKLND